MSIDHNIHLGYYFDVKPAKVNHTIEYDGCPKCKKELNTPFCPVCGSKSTDMERVENYKASIYEMCAELGDEWDDFLIGTDPMTGKHDTIAVPNTSSSFNLDIDDHFTLDLNNFKIPEMDSDTKEFVAAFKERFGEDAIKVHFGFVNWYS